MFILSLTFIIFWFVSQTCILIIFIYLMIRMIFRNDYRTAYDVYPIITNISLYRDNHVCELSIIYSVCFSCSHFVCTSGHQYRSGVESRASERYRSEIDFNDYSGYEEKFIKISTSFRDDKIALFIRNRILFLLISIEDTETIFMTKLKILTSRLELRNYCCIRTRRTWQTSIFCTFTEHSSQVRSCKELHSSSPDKWAIWEFCITDIDKVLYYKCKASKRQKTDSIWDYIHLRA